VTWYLAAAALVLIWPARLKLGLLVAVAGPGRLVVGSVGLLAVIGLIAGGAVGGVVAGSYAALGGRAVLRRSKRRQAAASRARILDDLAGMAADLRAGLPPTAIASTDRVVQLTSAVWRLAERTGAPAADLVERIEADARAQDRAAATAAAQAAGAQATAMLLVALPVGGIGLGISMGADPVGVLLHTPIGAGCAVAAVLLQCGGLLWSERLVAGVTS
jgi:tight adherence protein B